MWRVPPNSSMETDLPLRSRIVRFPLVANSSKQPTWAPANTTMGSPASIRLIRVAPYVTSTSDSPDQSTGSAFFVCVLQISKTFGLQEFAKALHTGTNGAALERLPEPRRLGWRFGTSGP